MDGAHPSLVMNDPDELRSFAESIVDTVRDPLLVLDADLRVILASRVFYEAFRVPPRETVGRRIYELGNGQWDIPALRTQLEDILPRESAFRDFAVDHVFPQLGRRHMLLNGRRLRQHNARRELILLAIEDVTERRMAETARHEAEARFTEMVKNVRDYAVFMTDPQGTITSWNVAAERVFGHAEAEAIGQPFAMIFTPEDVTAGAHDEELRQAREAGRAEDERWHLRKGGERFWAQGIVTPRRDGRGQLVGYSKILRDMSERQRAETALRASQQQFRRAMSIATVGVLFFRLDGRVLDANAAFCRMSGHSVESLRALPDWIALTPPEFHAVTTRTAQALAERGDAAPYEKQMLRADGSRFWGLFAPTRLEGSGPETVCVEFILDITGRKRTEEALQRSEERHAFLLRLSDALRLLGAPAEILATANRLLGEALGVDRAYYVEIDEARATGTVRAEFRCGATPTLVGEHRLADYDWILPAMRAGQMVVIANVERSSRIPEDRRATMRAVQVAAHVIAPLVKNKLLLAALCVTEHRPRAWLDSEVALVRETAERIWAAVERSHAEAALRSSEERLRLALVAARMGTWHWEPSSDRQRRDANLNRLLGLEPVETVRPLEEFFIHIHPDDQATVRTAFGASMRMGHELQVDFRVVRPGGEICWLSDKGDVFGAGAGRYLAGACVDITDRKRLEAELLDADRRKDEFLAMLGHELRNPLAPLRNVLEALRRSHLDEAALERACAMMDRQVGHLSRLVNDLLDVSRITLGLIELQKEPVNVAEVAEAAVEMAMPAVTSRRLELTLAWPRKPLRIQGDRARLIQVVFNLLNNAAKYTPAGGQIWLSLEREDGWVALRVRDNGSGMTSDLVPRVFDLFTQGARTLDRAQGGLGLGLTLVKRLVEKHGGSVAATSPGPGLGSEFVVRLPACNDAEQAPAPASALDDGPLVAGVDALVVDDVRDIADSYVWLFEGLVDDVRVAYSGDQALTLAGERAPDLVVCDLGMPGMDGYETCRRLRELPGLDTTLIAAVSGYGGDEYVRASKQAGFDRHLVKPISRATLEALVRSAVSR